MGRKNYTFCNVLPKYNDAITFVGMLSIPEPNFSFVKTKLVIRKPLKVAIRVFWLDLFQEFYDCKSSSKRILQTNMLFIHTGQIAFIHTLSNI